jgi:hypothetical protein
MAPPVLKGIDPGRVTPTAHFSRNRTDRPRNVYGMAGGGTGECQLPGGQQIDAQFPRT